MNPCQCGYVYILHFDRPLAHSQHYIGCTLDPLTRWTAHAMGAGARIVEAALEEGIGFTVGAVGICGVEEMRSLERKMKNWHGAADQCEICNPDANRAIPGTRPMPVCLIPFPRTSDELKKLHQEARTWVIPSGTRSSISSLTRLTRKTVHRD